MPIASDSLLRIDVSQKIQRISEQRNRERSHEAQARSPHVSHSPHDMHGAVHCSTGRGLSASRSGPAIRAKGKETQKAYDGVRQMQCAAYHLALGCVASTFRSETGRDGLGNCKRKAAETYSTVQVFFDRPGDQCQSCSF